MLTAPTIAFAAARLRKRWIWLSAVVFVACAVLGFETEAADNPSFAAQVWSAIVIGIGMLGGFAETLWLRRSVFVVDVVRTDRRLRRGAIELAKRDPQEALRLQIGRADIDERDRYPDGGVIDLNNLPPDTLCHVTGIDADTAARIASAREQVDGFKSLADLLVLLNLPPHLFDVVEGRLIFLPRFGQVSTVQKVDPAPGTPKAP
jgi:hypothetical protein